MAASRSPDFSGPRKVPRSRTPLNADTSSQPEGLTRRVMLNILEAFFRRPWLHLLPLILMLALGAASVLNARDEYRSVGTLSVTNESLLADLTNAASTPGLSFESAATVTARQINELLRTEDFFTNVIANAGLITSVEQNPLLRAKLRSATSAFADGDSIVRVASVSDNPELSFRLADGTIKSYEEWVVDSYVSQSESTVVSLQKRVDEKRASVQAANDALNALIQENPLVAISERSAADQLSFSSLQSTANRAQDKLDEAVDALDAAELQSDQASAIVAQRLRVLDPPEQPAAPEGRLKSAALTLIVFGVLGTMLSLASVVISAMLDRTIRIPNDVTAKFGLDVLAVVPDMAR